MAIKSATELPFKNPRIIDLRGPHGNAYYLLSLAKEIANLLGRDADAICARMEASDYNNLIGVFDAEFGDFFDLYR